MSDHFRCPLPWMKIEVFPRFSRVCAYAAEKLPPPSPAWDYLLGASVLDIINGPRLQTMRQEMVAGGPPVACHMVDGCEVAKHQIVKDGPPEFVANAEQIERHYLAGDLVLTSYPQMYTISVGEICPFRCRGCYTLVPGAPPRAGWMPLEIARRLAEGIQYATFWVVTGGEPFAAPADLMDILLPESRPPRCHFCVFTSLCVEPEVVERLAPRADRLVVSYQHPDPAELSRLKGGFDSEKMHANARIAARTANLMIQTLVMRSTLETLPAMVPILVDLGARSWSITPFVDYGVDGDEDIISGADVQQAAAIMRIVDEAAGLARGRGIEVESFAVQGRLSAVLTGLR